MALRNVQVELEFGNVGFYGGRKSGVPGEKPSEQGREPGCYAGVEACCKIYRRHHPSDPQLLFQRLTIVATGGR